MAITTNSSTKVNPGRTWRDSAGAFTATAPKKKDVEKVVSLGMGETNGVHHRDAKEELQVGAKSTRKYYPPRRRAIGSATCSFICFVNN
jgi:hypothetical protein